MHSLTVLGAVLLILGGVMFVARGFIPDSDHRHRPGRACQTCIKRLELECGIADPPDLVAPGGWAAPKVVTPPPCAPDDHAWLAMQTLGGAVVRQVCGRCGTPHPGEVHTY